MLIYKSNIFFENGDFCGSKDAEDTSDKSTRFYSV